VKRSVLVVAAALAGAGAALAAADDLNSAFQSLQAAESKKDVAAVKKSAIETYKLAREVVSSPAPEGGVEKENWQHRVEYAKEIEVQVEYALYATALAVQAETAKLTDLIAALEELNPKSKYLNEPDVLLVEAELARTRRQYDRALAYANRLVAALNSQSKPESVSQADWDRRRTAALGRGYWIAGVVSGEKNQYAAADKNLRAALPLIKGNDAMMGPALFFLGVANYQLGKMTLSKSRVLEASRFSDDSAKIEGPYQQQAWKNAAAMRAEAATMR